MSLGAYSATIDMKFYLRYMLINLNHKWQQQSGYAHSYSPDVQTIAHAGIIIISGGGQCDVQRVRGLNRSIGPARMYSK